MSALLIVITRVGTVCLPGNSTEEAIKAGIKVDAQAIAKNIPVVATVIDKGGDAVWGVAPDKQRERVFA